MLDQPVSALDVSVGAQIVNLLRTLQREHGMAYLFITHSMPLVRYLADRIVVMQRGKVVEEGEADQLCRAPRQPYTQALIAATPQLPASVRTASASGIAVSHRPCAFRISSTTSRAAP